MAKLSFILMILAPSAHSGILTKEWIPLPRDCLSSMLSTIANDHKLIPEKRMMLEAGAHHNDEIFVKFNEISPEKWDQEITKTIDHYAAFDLDFDAASFKKWIKESNLKPKSDETIGNYLQKQNVAFVKKYPKGKIDDVVNAVTNDIKAIAKECGENIACNEQKIAATLEKNQSKLCFMKKENRKSALKSMITGLAFANAGYAMTTAQDPNHDYPYDLTLTNLMWSPIMTELGCRSTLGSSSVGTKIELYKPIYRSTEWWTKTGNKYISYMILSPLSNATYVAFHTTKQVLFDKTLKWEDVRVWDLTKQVASLSLWDAAWPVPRMVMITDPLYLKGVPGMNKFLSSKWSKAGASIPTYAVDWGSRLGLSYLNSKWVNWWIGKSDQWWDTNFSHQKKSETPTTSVESNSTKSKEIGLDKSNMIDSIIQVPRSPNFK